MLTLAHPRPAPAALVLHRVGSWQLSADLQHYVEHALSARWPGVGLLCARTLGELDRHDIDLWLCGEAPAVATNRPALVLGAVARQARLIRVGEQLWSCATPLNAHTLIRHIEQVTQLSAGRIGNQVDHPQD